MNKPIKHAYLILAYNNFKIHNKLLELLDDPDNDFYFLIDEKVSTPFEKLITYVPKYSKIYQVPGMKVYWGSYNQTMAEFRLLQYSVGKYDYYHMMQGADFPIKSREYIKHFFQINYGKEFVRFKTGWYKLGEYKINYHHFFVNNKYYRKCIFLRGFSQLIGRTERFLHLEHGGKEKIYSGSAMWSITDDFAKYIVAHETYIKKRCKYTIASDEVIFHTLLMQSPYRDNVFMFETPGADLYAIDWTRRVHNSPHIYAMDDFDYLMNQDEFYLYARKFSEQKDFSIIEKLFDSLKEVD